MGKGVPDRPADDLVGGMCAAEVAQRVCARSLFTPQRAGPGKNHGPFRARIVTLFYSDFDPLTGLLRYATRHNPPLICRREGYRFGPRLDARPVDRPAARSGLWLPAGACSNPEIVIPLYTEGSVKPAAAGALR